MPFTNILTHFPIDENLTINYGRLGEEAVRVKDIVSQSDDNTLILFNETYSTTSSSDGVYLARDLIRVLKEKGSYVIFNTHLHDLAKEIPEMNKWNGQGDIISIIMERKDDKNTFMLKRAEPDCCSYARDIALKYGITYEQMTDK
jgi:DNA mismatch repair ATPase MutS